MGRGLIGTNYGRGVLAGRFRGGAGDVNEVAYTHVGWCAQRAVESVVVQASRYELGRVEAEWDAVASIVLR